MTTRSTRGVGGYGRILISLRFETVRRRFLSRETLMEGYRSRLCMASAVDET